MECNDRLMEDIDPDNYLNKEKVMFYNYRKFNENFATVFDNPIFQVTHFDLNSEYDAEKNNPIFLVEYNYLKKEIQNQMWNNSIIGYTELNFFFLRHILM
jgi:hypothetical protein